MIRFPLIQLPKKFKAFFALNLLLEPLDGSNCHEVLPQGHCHEVLPHESESIKAGNIVNIIHEVLNKTCCVICNEQKSDGTNQGSVGTNLLGHSQF
jgi:hypothetical protein